MRRRLSASSNDEESSSSDSCAEQELNLNISNDQYYKPLASDGGLVKRNESKPTERNLEIPIYGSSTIQHSLPAYDLWKPFFPTYLSEEKYLNFHRPKLRHYNTGPQSRKLKRTKGFPIKNLSRFIFRCQKKLRFNVINAINEGRTRAEIYSKYLLIRDAKDLTAKNGELFFFEYSEEHPPVLSQIGMASNVKIYTKSDKSLLNYNKIKAAHDSITSKKSNDNDATSDGQEAAEQVKENANNFTQPIGNYDVGIKETVRDEGNRPNSNKTTQLYYNLQKPGISCKFIENNLYRAPIFEQDHPATDFLVIRTRNSFYIRQLTNTYTVGQTMPLVSIPEPNNISIHKFRRSLSNVYLHKLFRESYTNPPSIDLNLVVKLFPDYNRQIFRDRLKRLGVKCEPYGSRCLRDTSKLGTLSLQELRRSFSPEQYCLNMAMLAARERLKDLNYTDSMIVPPDDAEKETEVLAAPWNTSKSVIAALNGRTYLDFRKHLIDPTGAQREGFSCVTWSKSPTEDQQLKERQVNRTSVIGSANNSGPISLVNPLAQKIKREKLERLAIYQREAQHISEVQSSSLGSNAVLSSSEGEEEEEDEENLLDKSFDQQLHMLDKLVIGGQTMQELDFEREEEERQQMLKEFCQNEQQEKPTQMQVDDLSDSQQRQINVASFKNKILRITRTYDTAEGRFERTEIVREPKIIALYVKKKGNSDNRCNEVINGEPNGGDKATMGCSSTQNRQERRSSVSLGPSELCRADGMILTISKKVLNFRDMRRQRRATMAVD